MKLSIHSLFRKNDGTQPDVPRRRYGAFSGGMGLAINLLLFGGKLFAGQITGSVAVTADAFNNLSDAGSSAVTLFCFRMADKKPDARHPFGHGKIEYLAGLFVSVAILFTGFELIKSSVEKILHPSAPVWELAALLILAFSICLKLWMYLFNRALGKKAASATLLAVAKDSLSDVAATGVVLAGAILERFSGLYLDGYLGVVIALFVLCTGYAAARDTINPLLGQQPDPELVSKIETCVLAHRDIRGVHDLIVHEYGPGRAMISLHAEVSDQGNIVMVHNTIDSAERDLKEQFGCDAVIHIDPIVTDDRQTNEVQEKLAALVQLIDPSVSIHDFRMSRGAAHTKLIFDVVVPYGFRLTDKQVAASISKAVRALDPTYLAVVQVDKIAPKSL